jgi:hypothetical protein
MLILGDTPGYVYIFCFDHPLGNLDNPRAMAKHYLGWTIDLPHRLATHLAGRGQHITAAAVARGITWSVFAWHGTPNQERYLKRKYKKTPRLCPRCCQTNGWRCRMPLQPIEQLTLFDTAAAPAAVEPWPEGFEFPDPPALSMPRDEAWKLQLWRAARVGASPALAAALDDLV